jgi:hypothetical protein
MVRMLHLTGRRRRMGVDDKLGDDSKARRSTFENLNEYHIILVAYLPSRSALTKNRSGFCVALARMIVPFARTASTS